MDSELQERRRDVLQKVRSAVAEVKEIDYGFLGDGPIWLEMTGPKGTKEFLAEVFKLNGNLDTG